MKAKGNYQKTIKDSMKYGSPQFMYDKGLG